MQRQGESESEPLRDEVSAQVSRLVQDFVLPTESEVLALIPQGNSNRSIMARINQRNGLVAEQRVLRNTIALNLNKLAKSLCVHEILMNCKESDEKAWGENDQAREASGIIKSHKAKKRDAKRRRVLSAIMEEADQSFFLIVPQSQGSPIK